jgi:hypothetical protein
MELTANETPLPRWMERMRQEEALVEARQDAANQRALLAARMVTSDGLAYWDGFVKELRFQATLFDSIGIRGSVSLTPPKDERTESMCHIEVALNDSLWPSITNATFFYRSGQHGIRSHGQDKNTPSFHFQIYGDELQAITDNYSSPMNAEQAAELVLITMVGKVKGRK